MTQDVGHATLTTGLGSKTQRGGEEGGKEGPRRGLAGRGRGGAGNGNGSEAEGAGQEGGGGTGVRRRRRCSLQFPVVHTGSTAAMMIHGFQSSHQDFSFGPWKLTADKTHIMKSADVEKLADELHMPSLPEMMFGDNVLRIQHGSGFGIEFNARDALRCVNNYQGMLKVACAEEWQESRTEGEHSKEVIKPYDWTYTTDYKGTLLGESLKLKVVPTTDHIDTEKLKTREQIKFFEEVLLFEDELHDHGVSSLSVKIHVSPSLFTEPNEISQYLPIKEVVCEKLLFPERIDSNPADSQESTPVNRM
ncbi:TIP41-like protein [Galemys pyrenaicus]|uniref:TIP41-like protein n=1 Tax=Galemys pyrenaicus TaxID=202257 RepID=A0A8J6AEM3_GALPY|nr:TIP41-like protein [Galemys pyrenaicus]